MGQLQGAMGGGTAPAAGEQQGGVRTFSSHTLLSCQEGCVPWYLPVSTASFLAPAVGRAAAASQRQARSAPLMRKQGASSRAARVQVMAQAQKIVSGKAGEENTARRPSRVCCVPLHTHFAAV